MTQTDRVLAALSRAGARGITRVDFLLPNVIDGGKPIINIPARIKDLRDDGIQIENAGERDSCAVYRLSKQEESSAPTLDQDAGSLFDAPAEKPHNQMWAA